jgi:hypothetical protein
MKARLVCSKARLQRVLLTFFIRHKAAKDDHCWHPGPVQLRQCCRRYHLGQHCCLTWQVVEALLQLNLDVQKECSTHSTSLCGHCIFAAGRAVA